VRDILAGVVLILIGLVEGGSIFLGDFSLITILFDGLGILFIIRGIIKLSRARRAVVVSPPPPPSPPPTHQP
jgi:hypothetical protein